MIKEMIITYDTDDTEYYGSIQILERQELVRCKYCIYYDEIIQYTEDGVRYCDCIYHNKWRTEDYFCADGERKNNETN